VRIGPFEIEDATHRARDRDTWAAMGLISDRTPSAALIRNAVELADHVAIIDGEITLTWSQIASAAGAFAAFLTAQGIGHGDVVSTQLPTWWESVVVMHGTWMVGAVSNPIVSIFREHELGQVLAAVRPACVVTAESFRSCAHVELLDSVCAAAGLTPSRVVVRGAATGWHALDEILRGRAGPVVGPMRVDDPALLLYTSGTEAAPKAVVHTASTMLAAAERGQRTRALDWTDRVYAGGASLAHVGGLERVVLGALVSGHGSVIRDRWDAERAVGDFVDHGVTFTSGSTVFIREVCDVIETRPDHRFEMRKGFMCGGSAMVGAVLERAEALGLRPVRGYGMTEYCGSVSTALLTSPADVRLGSDGLPTAGSQITVSADGELLIRGPALAVGYLDPAQTARAYTADGSFRTGDTGAIAADGTVHLKGRIKDIINRGGEKIAAQEIETLLEAHESVGAAAVVAAPHERLGEQPAAIVFIKPGRTGDELALAAFLQQRGLAPQKIPRLWRWTDQDLPRSPAGKVRKDALRSLTWPV
jgi:acyl-coenzyme A synthetase/AMP-(fatty) acid ligase